jgi:hypothetical protein
MSDAIDSLFTQDPAEWVSALPDFQRRSITPLLEGGRTHEEVAELWLNASAANTFKMGATPQVRAKDSFLTHVKKEVRAFLCGDPKYETERSGLFGEKAPTRAFVVSSIAVAIAPTLGVAAPFLSPIVALVIAGLGKIVLNAWCAATAVEDSAG